MNAEKDLSRVIQDLNKIQLDGAHEWEEVLKHAGPIPCLQFFFYARHFCNPVDHSGGDFLFLTEQKPHTLSLCFRFFREAFLQKRRKSL
jgi:hypothetical protein